MNRIQRGTNPVIKSFRIPSWNAQNESTSLKKMGLLQNEFSQVALAVVVILPQVEQLTAIVPNASFVPSRKQRRIFMKSVYFK